MENNQPAMLQEQPVAQSSMTPRKSNTFVMILAGIVLFGLGLLGGYFLFGNKHNTDTTNVANQISPTQVMPSITTTPSVDTSSWMSYNNRLGLYSFKHPTDWEISPFPTPDQDNKNIGRVDIIQVDNYVGSKQASAKATLQINVILASSNLAKSVTPGGDPITIDSEQGFRVIDTDPSSRSKDNITVTHGKYQYHFEFNAVNYQESKMIYDKLLSNFKFTN